MPVWAIRSPTSTGRPRHPGEFSAGRLATTGSPALVRASLADILHIAVIVAVRCLENDMLV